MRHLPCCQRVHPHWLSVALTPILLAVLAVFTLGALAGCGRQPSGPGTQASGSVVITTDHSIYGPGNTIHVTVTNHLAIPIRTQPKPHDCLITGMEFQRNGAWKGAVACGFTVTGDENKGGTTQEIMPGSTVSGTITLGSNTPLSTYRLVFTYLPLPSASPPPGTRPPDWTTVYSATFQVKN